MTKCCLPHTVMDAFGATQDLGQGFFDVVWLEEPSTEVPIFQRVDDPVYILSYSRSTVFKL